MFENQSADLAVIGHQAVFTHIDPVLEAEQVGHLPLWTLTQTHGLPACLSACLSVTLRTNTPMSCHHRQQLKVQGFKDDFKIDRLLNKPQKTLVLNTDTGLRTLI